ncbi:MAG: ATP-binding cassette domain-containing protein [Methanomicrobiales archaeon]|nr:ATP-binding cassette domain-containing protein [Methanomicrobiales archaeon]NYT20922.1 ATP-binding cassette domain-containing protein [Methanomicrobiales archaeon]
MHLVETRDLSYVYPGGVKGLDAVNFIAERNSRIAVIGANGAGKSTLFKHFNGILRPSSGTVLIHGEPVTDQNIREVRKFVGLVFQNADDQIFSPTVEQDVAFGPMNLGLDGETVSHRVDEALSMVGIEHLRDRVPHHLSGGEKKRVAIAGVIAMEPQVLVLDEPTAGLDPQGVKDLIGVINTLARRYGITVIFSTHDVSLVPEVADRLYVMDRGRIVAGGTVAEVFADQELLTSVRLDIPVIPKLLRSLRNEGMDIGNAFTLDEATAALLRCYRGRE